MKFLNTIAVTFMLVATTFAQRAAIGFPSDGASVKAGSSITVEVDRPNSLSSSQEVAIVIGFQSCANSPCHDPSNGLGTILYNGGFKPQYQPGATSKPPHQNYTITIPTAKGKAQLGVAHISLIGAGLSPFMETMGINLNVV